MKVIQVKEEAVMTPEQEKHLEDIKDSFAEEVTRKYTGGVKQHGGNLWEKGMEFQIEQAMQEAIDMYVYLYTLREDIRTINKRMENTWQGRQ